MLWWWLWFSFSFFFFFPGFRGSTPSTSVPFWCQFEVLSCYFLVTCGCYTCWVFLFFIWRVASFCLFFFPGFWMNRFSFTIVPVCFNENLTVRYSLCKHCHEKMATPVAPWGCAIFQFLLSWTRDLIFCYFLDDNVRTEEMNYGHDEMARSSQKNPNQLMALILIRFFLFHSSARPENQRKMRSRRKFTMRTPPSSTMRHHLAATAAPKQQQQQ